jgi:hypothetical protein
LVVDEGDGDNDADEDPAILEEAEVDAGVLIEDPEGNSDEGQGAHNEHVVKTLRERAIEMMEAKGIYIDADEKKMALQIFPRVSCLLSTCS